MNTDQKFALKFTDQWGETYFFVSNGPVHTTSALGRIHLIDVTSPDVSKARKFETAPEAAQVLVDAGRPCGWDIVTIPS